jgi:hypothetical protein
LGKIALLFEVASTEPLFFNPDPAQNPMTPHTTRTPRTALWATTALLSCAAALVLATTATAATPPKRAAAPAAPSALSAEQLEAAARVMVGTASCDDNEKVQVTPVANQPGYFKLSHGKDHYVLTPKPTTTGAVRLEDAKSGMVWLQIPSKSMLMNSKLGRRVVDACQMAEQR